MTETPDDRELRLLRALVHRMQLHPDYEYARTDGPRKASSDDPPEGEGWERNVDRGSNGFERFEYHEEHYWRRRVC